MGQQQSSNNNQSHHFQHRFISNSHPLYPQSNNLQLLHQKLTSKIFVLNIITTNDQIQSTRLNNIICKKIANKCTNITPIQHYIIDQKDGICGKSHKCFIVIQIGKPIVKSIKHILLEKQCNNQQPFSNQVLNDSIQDICNALLYLKFVNHPHTNLSTQTIYYDQQLSKFILTDPWISPLKQNSAGQYPSPQKLQKISNSSDYEDPYLSDLFSYGMVILECMFGVPTGIYKPNYKIDIKRIVQLINQVQHFSLKQKLRVMLVGSQQQKKRLLHSYTDKVYKKKEKGNYNEGSMIKNTTNHLNSLSNLNSTKNIQMLKYNNIQNLQQNKNNKPQFTNLGKGNNPKTKQIELSNKNSKPPQISLITNANSNGYQKLSMPTSQLPNNKTVNSYTNNYNYKVNNIQIGNSKINNNINIKKSTDFPMKKQSQSLTPNLFANNNNIQIVKSHIFVNNSSNNFINEKYLNDFKQYKPQYYNNQIQNSNKIFIQYPNAKFDFLKSLYKAQQKNQSQNFNLSVNLHQKNLNENLVQKNYIQLSQSSKFPTQGTPNDTPNHSKNNSHIFNSQNSQENILYANGKIVKNINEGFKKLQNKIVSAFTYQSTIPIDKFKTQELVQQNKQESNKNKYSMNQKIQQNFINQKNKNIQEQINKKQSQFQKLPSQQYRTVQLKQCKSQFDSFHLSVNSQQIVSQQNQTYVNETPNLQNFNFKKMIVKNISEESQDRQKEIQFPETPSSLVKVDQNKNTIQYVAYLTKNSQQRIGQYQKYKKSPQGNQSQLSSHSPATKVPIFKQSKDSQEYYLSYSYSDSNPDGISQRQSHTNEEIINSQNKGQIDIKQQNQKQNSPISSQQGTTVGRVGNLIIYEQSDDDSQSNKTRNRGEPVQQVYENGGRYKGYIYNGKRDGQGTFYYKDGGFYQGMWKNNMMNGYGKLYYDTGKLAYEGYWHKDQFHGRGKVYNDCPEILQNCFDYTDFENIQLYWQYYEGDLVHDSKQGSGKIMLSNGQSFEGEFHNDKVDGKGLFKSNEGRVIRGIWQNCKLVKILS